MNKSDLISVVAEKSELKKVQAEKAVNVALEAITNALSEGEKVQLIGFGTFEVRERKERVSKNPRTQEPMTIPAQKAPAFKAGSALKEAVK